MSETKKKGQDKDNLGKMTVKELREIAAKIPHERAIIDMKKDELVAFIKEARGIQDITPAKRKKHVVKIKMTKTELKTRIRELKILKGQALESHDNKKIEGLRHQISQLKKKSRRVAAAVTS